MVQKYFIDSWLCRVHFVHTARQPNAQNGFAIFGCPPATLLLAK